MPSLQKTGIMELHQNVNKPSIESFESLMQELEEINPEPIVPVR